MVVAFLASSAFGQLQQEEYVAREGNDLLWCCLSAEELRKCQNFAEAVNRDHLRSEYTFGSYYHRLKCRRFQDKDECMRLIDDTAQLENPNLMNVDAGDVFVGGRYHSLVPILKEVYDSGRDYYHSIAVVKKGSMTHVKTMRDLRGSRACFPKVGSLAGWTMPINRLMEEGVIEIADCNNHVKSAINFFGQSCAVNSLKDRYNPLGDNPHHFCELCGSDEPGVRCTNQDPFAGYTGALMCLAEKGDIAFLHERVIQLSEYKSTDFELLCPVDEAGDGDDVVFGAGKSEFGRSARLVRRPLSDYEECSWGVSPGNAIVVSSAMDMNERLAVQTFLKKAAELYGGRVFTDADAGDDAEETVPDEGEAEDDEFHLFESVPKYGMIRNLLVSDSARDFVAIKPDFMSYKSFLEKTYGSSLSAPMRAIEGVRKCPVGDMKLCVTSLPEMAKCTRMRTALNAQLLAPKMSCRRARSHLECMQQIRRGDADVVVLDAGDVYRAGWAYDLIPIMAEVYNLDTPHYYAVAVAKQRDNSSELIYLKRRNTCHTGVGHAAGWVVPLAWLIANERVRDYGCDSVRAAAEYFSKSCAPGAQSAQFQNRYEADYWEYSHLCDLCHGTAGSYCKRNHMEDYYGHTGAFRCLVEGGGHVAFVKHTTVMENCDGKRKEWWARNQLTNDYELLCRDGTRAPARDYKRCFMGKVNSNAIVTRQQSKTTIDAFINLFNYAQQFYGQKVSDEFSFSMFITPSPYADLIFQDATQQLIVLPEEKRHYTTYLDREFLKAYEIVDCRSTGVMARTVPGAVTMLVLWTLLC